MFHEQTEGVIAIRRWQFEDLDAVHAIECQAGANAIDRGTIAAWTMTTYEIRGYVITEDEEVRGYTALFLTRDGHEDIQALRVDKDHQGRRFGTRLLAHLITELPNLDKSGENRWQSLCADIDSTNEPAVRLFSKSFVKRRIRLYLDYAGNIMRRRYEMEYPEPPDFCRTTVATNREMFPSRQ